MSLFGSLMGDLENDPIFGSHMRTMRHMNSMMNSLFNDPFGDFMGIRDFGLPALTNSRSNSLMPFGGFPAMPNINRLLNSFDNENAHCYSSSTVVSMTSGPDGRPHVYKATSSTRTAPGGVKETQKTVCDTRTGTKKMAIGHHIGERAHIIEREHNLSTGDQEERQDFINLDEEEADDFNKEWEERTRNRSEISRITGNVRHRHGRDRDHSGLLAITAGPTSSARRHACTNATRPDRRDKIGLSSIAGTSLTPRRTIRSIKQETPPSSRRPYSPPGHSHSRKNKNIKSVSGSPSSAIHD